MLTVQRLAYLGMQCRLHELRHKRRISVAAASKILANLVYSYKGMGLSMGTMCAGVTPQEGPALYYIDSDGMRLAGNLFCVGSGQTFAYGVLDAEYRYDLSVEEALELGRRSILAATHRDAFSGGYINLYHVRVDGWVKHGFNVRLRLMLAISGLSANLEDRIQTLSSGRRNWRKESSRM
jgi:20S proteasome subunit beta 5